MKLIKIELSPAPSENRNYNYKVEIQGNDQSTWTTVHTGKFFALKDQTKVVLDLDDILYDHRFVGKQVLEPTLYNSSQLANEWIMPALGSNTPTNCSEYWYNNVKVSSENTPAEFDPQTKKFYFMPAYDLCGNARISLDPPNQQTITLGNIPILTPGQPTPHIPNNPPSGFQWAQPVYVWVADPAAQYNVGVRGYADNTPINDNAKGCKMPQIVKLYNTKPATDSFSIQIGNNKRTVTKIDSCNKPYYLIWLTNEGGLQCQSFESVSDFSIGYEIHNRVDMHNSEWKVNSTATGNWKLKSQNLSDTEFKAYGDIFNSPYVVLLDMINSRLHYVQVKTTDYEEKKRTRINRKPIYFSIEVESADHWMV